MKKKKNKRKRCTILLLTFVMQYNAIYAMIRKGFHKNTAHLKSACRVVKGIEILTFFIIPELCGSVLIEEAI